MPNKYEDTLYDANDVGFSFAKDRIFKSVKGNVDDITVPSVSSYQKAKQEDKQRHSNDINNSNSISNFMNGNVYNHMIVTFGDIDMPNGNYYIGKSAEDNDNAHGFSPDEVKQGRKGLSDLSHGITFSIIAYKALNDAYNSLKKIPSNIDVKVIMYSALPESEATMNATAIDKCINYYKKGVHNLHILNFRKGGASYDVNVNITFKHVGFTVEGALARYPINNLVSDIKGAKKPELLTNFENQMNKHYPDLIPKKYLDNYLINTDNALFLDFGEVTVDCIVMRNNGFQQNHSDSYTLGCKRIYDDAISDLGNNSKLSNFSTEDSPQKIRETFKDDEDFLKKNGYHDPVLRGNAKACKDALNRAVTPFIRLLLRQLDVVFNDSEAGFNKIIAFGGGLNELSNYGFQDKLRNELKKKNSNLPVLFVDKHDAQFINVKGLEIKLKNIIKGL